MENRYLSCARVSYLAELSAIHHAHAHI